MRIFRSFFSEIFNFEELKIKTRLRNTFSYNLFYDSLFVIKNPVQISCATNLKKFLMPSFKGKKFVCVHSYTG